MQTENMPHILWWPNNKLTTSTQRVTEFGSEIDEILSTMANVMKENQGIGLAANQIGIQKQIALVTKDDYSVIEMINPRILIKENPTTKVEGCLSVPGYQGSVSRYNKVVVEFYNKVGQLCVGTFEGHTAHVIQHEVDHLNGVVYVSYLSSIRRDIIRRKINKIKGILNHV